MVASSIIYYNYKMVHLSNTTTIGIMVFYSILGGLLSVILGLFSSLEFNTSSGPSIIMAALILFILSLLNIKQSIKLKN